jgi:hypothetical protein
MDETLYIYSDYFSIIYNQDDGWHDYNPLQYIHVLFKSTQKVALLSVDVYLTSMMACTIYF